MLLLALVGLLVALGSPSPAAAVNAREADAFVDSIGVNAHTYFSDTPYVARFEEVKARLGELGVRHLRDGLAPDRPDQYERLDELAAAGIGLTLILGSPAEGGPSGLEALLETAGSELEGIEALEGPNEYSTSLPHDPEWEQNLIAYQQALYEMAKADPTLSALPVIGPSIVHGDQDELGNIETTLDFGNIHSYPQGSPPDKLGSAIDRARLNSGPKPIMATETGYHTALGWSGEHPPVSEAAQAVYTPRLFFEYFRWGIARTFSYELVDSFADPPPVDAEAHFGLLRNDLSRKPAFDALRNTIAILEDPGPRFLPGALDYALSEGGTAIGVESPGLHKVLLQQRDGAFYLALWRTSSVWDAATGEPLDPGSAPVEVTVSPGLATAAVFEPTQSAGPVWSAADPGGTLSVDVGPAVTILRLEPSTLVPEGPQPQPATTQALAPPLPSGPPVLCVVPNLKGRSVASSRARLRRAHCRLTAIAGRRTPASRVASQRPAAGRVLPAGASVRVRLRSDD